MPAHGLVQRADAVAQPRRAMQLDHRRLLGGPRVAICHGNGDRFLERQDVLHLRVVGQCVQEALLDSPRIAEHVVNAIGKQLFDQREASGLVWHALPTPATQAIFQNFDHQFADQVRVLGRTPGQEGVVKDRGDTMSDSPVILAIWAYRIPQNVFKGIKRRAKIG